MAVTPSIQQEQLLQEQQLQQQQHENTQQQQLLHYPELRVIFDFFGDNPQKMMPPKKPSHMSLAAAAASLGHAPLFGSSLCSNGVAVEGGSLVVADPYWNSIRKMQTDPCFLEGMLLKSVDHKAQYPYLHYIVYKDAQAAQDKSRLSLDRRAARSPELDFSNVPNFSVAKTRGAYREMCTYVTPDTPLLPKRPTNPNTAFAVSAFKTVGNLDSLDKTWTYWSGADYIVENIPKSLKLERLTFHKLLPAQLGQPFVSRAPSLAAFNDADLCPDSIVSASSPASDHSPGWGKEIFSYVLLCEIGEALLDMNRTREFIDTLKYRQCGVTSMYVIDHFF